MLPIPITPADALAHIVVPALRMLPARMDTDGARVMLLAIAGQESGLAHRFQVIAGRPSVKGPARGLWQFERGGGVVGVLKHPSSRDEAHRILAERNAPDEPTALWELLEHDDLLACVLARLLLWTDPRALPEVGDVAGGWNLYIRTWRPGRPHISRWKRHYDAAVEAVTA